MCIRSVKWVSMQSFCAFNLKYILLGVILACGWMLTCITEPPPNAPLLTTNHCHPNKTSLSKIWRSGPLSDVHKCILKYARAYTHLFTYDKNKTNSKLYKMLETLVYCWLFGDTLFQKGFKGTDFDTRPNCTSLLG